MTTDKKCPRCGTEECPAQHMALSGKHFINERSNADIACSLRAHVIEERRLVEVQKIVSEYLLRLLSIVEADNAD